MIDNADDDNVNIYSGAIIRLTFLILIKYLLY